MNIKRNVLGCLGFLFALGVAIGGCPTPPTANEAVREGAGPEVSADTLIERVQEEPQDAHQSEPTEPRHEPSSEHTPPETGGDIESPISKDCPRGKLFDAANNACINFPKRELVSEEVTFTNTKDGVVLSGTLLKPKVAVGIRLPVIVFIHGSGPNDRDETSAGALGLRLPKPVKVFQDIAEFFAAKGYIVLRYDKRTFGLKDPKVAAKWTVDSFTQDASAALDMLKKRNDVKPDDLTVMGHSQGGTLVLDLGIQRDDLKSIVMLAGPASPLKELLVAQFNQLVTWLQQTPPSAQRDQQINTLKAKADLYEKTMTAIENGTYQQSSFEGASVAFWKSWIENHKRIQSNLKKLTQPLAAISGTLDFNVTPSQTKQLETWRGSNTTDFFKVYDNVTHPLVHVLGNKAEESVYKPLLEDLLRWMNGQ